MVKAIITLKVMPETADVDLKELEVQVKETVEKEGGMVGRVEEEPIAFGLKALKITFSIDEEKGTDSIEEAVSGLEGAQSVQVLSYSRAMG